jgi:uncharacterized protein YegP (UPF0339 family)
MGKFILSVAKGKYAFYFSDDKGDRVACSLPHITRSASIHAIQETRKCSQQIHLYAKKEAGGNYYFELCNEVGNILAVSEHYYSTENRDIAIKSFSQNAEKAELVEAIMI